MKKPQGLRRWVDTRLRAVRSGDDHGFAMILVIGLGFVMTAVALAVLDTTLSAQSSARHVQDKTGAVGAADAGVDDYIYRLNNDSSYVVYSTVPNTCSGATVAANPDPSNAAMSGFVSVPGPTVSDLTAAAQPKFKYSVDISQYCTAGKLILTSTGKVGNSTRTVRTAITRRGFLDFIYFTDREVKDPALYTTNAFSGLTAPNNNATSQCGRRFWDSAPTGSPRPDSGSPACSLIQFAGGDQINGPLHTNDRAIAGNATFNGPAFTSWGYAAGLPAANNPSASQHYSPGTGTPNFAYNKTNTCAQVGAAIPATTLSNDLCVEAPLTVPPSNSTLAAQTDSRITSTPGCIYTGPTQITFNNNKMTVVSPYTALNEVAHPSNCPVGTNIALPANGVIYVQSVPAGYATTGLCQANAANMRSRGFGGLDPDGSGNPLMYRKNTTTGTFATGVTPSYRVDPAMTYPLDNDASPPEYSFSQGETQAYPCTAGDVYVSGTLKGRVTIGSERNIYVVGDIKYSSGQSTAGSNTDLLGLIANRYVEVYHPIDCPSAKWLTAPTSISGRTYQADSCPLANAAATGWQNVSVPTRGASFTDPQIDAAILSVQHSFRVQNYEYGSTLSTLNVFGAIAQLYRGIVAVSGTTGYVKNYVYDTRLKFQTPPFFVTPVQAPFQVSSYSEQ